ncbi:MAG: VWA domain-containing protein [Treponema sp.]|nr:VWA domain-containing protein [Treponema sp.]
MTFDYPLVLSAFAVFIPMALFDIFAVFKKSQYKLPPELAKKLRASVLFFRIFIGFSIIALAGPRWGVGMTVSEYRRGLDIVFAIDVSRSMDISDIQAASSRRSSEGSNEHSGYGMPSRLEHGISIVRNCLINVTGARYAAVIGRSSGFLAVPLTWDNETPLSFLNALDGYSMTGRSTNLEVLVDTAADSFQKSSPAQKVIVLVSDGESLAGIFRNAVNRCAREGIIINAVALGSDEGRPVPAYPASLADPGAHASTDISKRDSTAMRMAAERTGGVYIDGGNEDAAGILSDHLLSLSAEIRAGSGKSEAKERRTLFIILAIIAYAASKFTYRMPRSLLVSIIALSFILSSCSQGKLHLLEANYLNSQGRHDEAIVPYLKALEYKDAAPYAEYGLGLAFYSLDDVRAALIRYGNSQKILMNYSSGEHRELRYRNNYNSGIVFFEEGDFESAASAFKEALRADSRRADAKLNLELSLLSITRDTSGDDNNNRPQESESREILFDFIKEQEEQYWKSKEWAPEEAFTGPDY